jgi:hypothetical protein
MRPCYPAENTEDGQALAEFALVLPMLALLTFGTIEVAIWLQQQSSINAAAFMASRASSVLGGELNKTRTALTDYIDVSPPWLGRAVASMKKSGGSNRIELEARADRFTGLISALTGGEVSGFDTLAAGAALPMEYDPRAHGQAKTGPKSRFLIDYRVPATEKALAPAAVANAGKAVDAVKKANPELDPKDVRRVVRELGTVVSADVSTLEVLGIDHNTFKPLAEGIAETVAWFKANDGITWNSSK